MCRHIDEKLKNFGENLAKILCRVNFLRLNCCYFSCEECMEFLGKHMRGMCLLQPNYNYILSRFYLFAYISDTSAQYAEHFLACLPTGRGGSSEGLRNRYARDGRCECWRTRFWLLAESTGGQFFSASSQIGPRGH